MRVELDVRQPLVSPPGEEEKALWDELTLTDWPGPSSARPHLHRAHADAFYVVEGELEFAGATLRAGGFGIAPPGVVHWFVAREGRFLNIHAPGGPWTRRLRARRDGRTVEDDEIDTFSPPAGATGDPLIVPPGEGEPLADDERVLRIKATLPQLCVFEFDAAPGYVGPKAHRHLRHVDAFYVLEGTLEFELDGERRLAEQGVFVATPPGVVHTFRNAGEDRARFLNLHAPGVRFDEYLRRVHGGENGRRFHESFDVYEVEVS